MTFATRMQALATRMTKVTKFGNSATFTHPNADKTYDRTTGKTTAGADITLATTIGGPIGVSPRLIDGSTVQENDQVIYVEATRLTFTIVPGETTVAVNGEVYAIVDITPFRTQDTDVAFRLVIR